MDLFQAMLRRFVGVGALTIIDHKGVAHAHRGGPGPEVTLRLHDAKVARDLLLNPELKAGEAYMDGRLTIEHGTLRDFLTLYALNRGRLRGLPLQKVLRRSLKTLKRWAKPNTAGRSAKNVEAHYDLSNAMYRLFLDEGLNYSCAYFRSPDDTLEQAQTAKLRHIAAKLDLKPGQRVLDIGSGWGSMAIYLAESCDVEVVGVTLSKEQLALARERAAARGLSGRVRFELMDYRDVEGPFDRIVSVGMFEHVGVKNFPAFFAKVSKLLAPDGVALLHSIGRKGGPGVTGAWVKKYIFPGGYSPALSETLTAIEGAKLWATDIEIWRLHYAETLVHWERRFQANRAQAAALLGERFCRMWEFYLITAEFSFRHGKHMVFQIQLTKDPEAAPLTRDYMGAREAELLAADARRGA
ncbi:cyclopropane-fatty-acyl-phospholipid synthase [Methylopila jiangsuensis]|uniref:Cyclopropane-fatty-acyl-phospholipid synthase n=1 Tax=Methylopila jiangsuensis TaxID=586230 RepID=A0A9W6JJG2_9HYPH|nr:cyclopropane-fatty-acyl-phospholipid synthase family protein [Methylopila jiangsuensis]MDR6287170.1 cyclopropane-fatty-acyl-phospholipid synthase [Methylopila jiangsuensis]GLK76658.1 cyclopropane-fatty-acyl-phospholipid synthase [Methylopila jiangsuensis]